MSGKRVLFFGLVLLLMGCSSSTIDESIVDETNSSKNSNPNILLIIADDMGLDATPSYTEGIVKPNMPNLQSLINRGVKFKNLWSYPVCSPTRASILTGKHGSKTGVVAVKNTISTTETSIQSFINSNTSKAYTSALIGKWHLSNNIADPITMGIDYFAGILKGGVQSYTNWNLTENDQTSISTEYTTTKLTDLAIDWVNEQTKPWFLWLAYNAPHTPFHLAPNGLHSQGNLPTDAASIDANPLPYYMSAIEAMDTEMGRLFNSFSAEEMTNTIIIFIGDNGSPNQVAQFPYSRFKSKNSLYQGGVNVPLIVAGKGVSRVGEETALIQTTDLFATIATAAGVATSSIEDSTSFYPMLTNNNVVARDFVYTEISNNEFGYAIRNSSYKLIKYDSGVEEFYHLTNDAYEKSNLIGTTLSTEASQAKVILEAEAIRIRG